MVRRRGEVLLVEFRPFSSGTVQLFFRSIFTCLLYLGGYVEYCQLGVWVEDFYGVGFLFLFLVRGSAFRRPGKDRAQQYRAIWDGGGVFVRFMDGDYVLMKLLRICIRLRGGCSAAGTCFFEEIVARWEVSCW